MEQATGAAPRLGEIIEATTIELVAESYRLHEAPALGSLVRASDGTNDVFAVVGLARTGSIDPGRRPVARGLPDDEEADIYRRHPELPQLLRTEFRALIVGYREHGQFRRFLPPRPPRLHGFVHECQAEELMEFTQRLDCLPTLLAAASPLPADEVVAAFLRQAGAVRPAAACRAFLIGAGKELARALGNNPPRLAALLARLQG